MSESGAFVETVALTGDSVNRKLGMLPLGAPRNVLLRPVCNLNTSRSFNDRLRFTKITPVSSLRRNRRIRQLHSYTSQATLSPSGKTQPSVFLNRYHQGQHTELALQLEAYEDGTIGTVPFPSFFFCSELTSICI